MKSIREIQRRLSMGALILTLGLAAQPAAAVLIVNIDVTPGGGTYHYDVSVDNSDVVDYLLVSLLDAPLGDALIDSTLTAPAEFLASYDSELGIIDFLGNTSDFLAGSFTSGFGFDSVAPPNGYFTTAVAFDSNLNLHDAEVRLRVVRGVPETGSSLFPMSLALCALVLGKTRSHAKRRLTLSLLTRT